MLRRANDVKPKAIQRAHRCPKGTEAAKRTPNCSHRSPKTSQRDPKGRPMGAQGFPKGATPNMGKETPKDSQRKPKDGQKGPKRAQRTHPWAQLYKQTPDPPPKRPLCYLGVVLQTVKPCRRPSKGRELRNPGLSPHLVQELRY
jgi:hypothetical protein